MIEAIDVWASEKAKPLRQIFLDRGAMPSARAALLETVVQEHLHLHGGDPERSLAALREENKKLEGETARVRAASENRFAGITLTGRRVLFLVDTSGSMSSPDRLPLLKQGLQMLVGTLRPEDRVAIVAYAGSAGLVLPSTPGTQKGDILAALSRLESGGSTNGGLHLPAIAHEAGIEFDLHDVCENVSARMVFDVSNQPEKGCACDFRFGCHRTTCCR